MTESATKPQDPNIPAVIPMHTLARMEATDALKAIKLGQFNGGDGLARCRGVIGSLAGYIFNLVIENVELKDTQVRADMVVAEKQGNKPLTKAQKIALQKASDKVESEMEAEEAEAIAEVEADAQADYAADALITENGE